MVDVSGQSGFFVKNTAFDPDIKMLAPITKNILILSFMTVASLFFPPCLTNADGTETTIEAGTWSGVQACRSGPAYVFINIHGISNGSEIEGSYWHERYKKRMSFKGKLRQYKDRPYEIIYNIAGETGIIFQGKTIKYMNILSGPGPVGLCGDAYLVPDEPEIFPEKPNHLGLCQSISSWVRDIDSVKEKIASFAPRSGIVGYNQDLALWGHQFSDKYFSSHFGRTLGDFSEEGLGRLIYKIRDCARISKQADFILERIDWFFDRSTVGGWTSRYGRSRLGFTGTFKNGYFEERLQRLQEIQAVGKKRAEIDQAIERILYMPESPELRVEMQSLSDLLRRTLVYQEVSYAEEIMSLYASKLEMLRASEALAEKFRLSSYPKLPAPDGQSAKLQVDDEVLKPLTDEEIEELEKPVFGDL